jgi:hypothetical protein
MKEVCHGWHFIFLYINFIYLSPQVFASEVQILLNLQPKFVKKLPLFGKIFIHPPSHSGIFHGPGQISMALPAEEV